MKDKDFIKLQHVTGKFKIFSKRSEIEEGYRPDLTLKDEDENIVYILENEKGTMRKGFIGDLTKAYKYCDCKKFKATLIIVLEEDSKRNVSNISNHMNPYFEWLKSKDKNKNYLHNVFIISDLEYQKSIEENEPIGSKAFFKQGIVF